MKIKYNKPPRQYKVGNTSNITINDMASIVLKQDEQVTFSNGNKQFDVCKKNWGFYATPSTNNRLKSFGYSTCICKNKQGHIYVLILDDDYEVEFQTYIKNEGLKVITWLDDDYAENMDN